MASQTLTVGKCLFLSFDRSPYIIYCLKHYLPNLCQKLATSPVNSLDSGGFDMKVWPASFFVQFFLDVGFVKRLHLSQEKELLCERLKCLQQFLFRSSWVQMKTNISGWFEMEELQTGPSSDRPLQERWFPA